MPVAHLTRAPAVVGAGWLLTALLIGLPGDAVAQTSVGVGVQAGTACINGGPRCVGSFVGPHLDVQWTRSLRLRLRHMSIGLDDRDDALSGILIQRRDRRAELTLAELLFLIRSPRRVSPVIGLAAGRRVYRQSTTCSPIDCETVRAHPGGPGVFGGELNDVRFSLGALGGLAVQVHDRLAVHALLGIFDPIRENSQTVETHVALSLVARCRDSLEHHAHAEPYGERRLH